MSAGKSDLTVERLIVNLQDPRQVVRLHAATVLGSMNDEAEAAVPTLIEMLEQGNVHDCRLAVLTSGEIGPVAEEARSALLKAAEDDDGGGAEMAVWALEQMHPADEEMEAA